MFYAYAEINQGKEEVDQQVNGTKGQPELPARHGDHGMEPAEAVQKANAPAGDVDASVLAVKAAAALPAQASEAGGWIGGNMFVQSCHKQKRCRNKEGGSCVFKDKRSDGKGEEGRRKGQLCGSIRILLPITRYESVVRAS